jgi:hypothetical protein
MPTFEQFVLAAPYGFMNSCLSLNRLLSDSSNGESTIIDELVTEAWNNIVTKFDQSNKFDTQHSNEKKGVAFIIRSMKTANPPPSISNAANILASNSFLTKDTIEKILIKVKELSAQEANNTADVKQILKVINPFMANFIFLFVLAISFVFLSCFIE